MRICLCYWNYLGPHDAGGSRWNQFAKYWSAQGHELTVLVSMVHYATGRKRPEYKGKFIVTEKDSDKVTLKRCHVSGGYNRNFLGRAWGYLSFALSSTVAGLWVEKPDILICTSPPLTVGLTGLLLSKLRRIPLVFEVRDLWPESAIDTGVLKNKWMIKFLYWLEKVCYNQAQGIVVLTPAFEEALVTRKGVPRHKICLIPNSPEIDMIKPGAKDNHIRERYGLKDKFIVTYVGAMGVANALTQLLETARILTERAPEVHVLLVGDGMEKDMLVAKARSWELTNVTFVDMVPKTQIADYINASDICVAVLKRVETFKTVYPNKVFDYMAAKKPIIVGIDGVARKLVERAGAGLFAEPEVPEDIADKVLSLKNNPQRMGQMAERGYAFVHKEFSPVDIARDYINFLAEVQR